jgi:chromosome partitioning protein
VRTIAVINRKGGSGKTTTAVNTAAALSEMGLPVLLIDLDPQGSASEWLDRVGSDEGMFQSFMGTGDLARLAVPTDVPGLDLIPVSTWLVTAERSLMGDLSLGISRAILGLPRRWAFVIVDCPPSLSYLSIGVLMAVRELIIPVEAHGMALSGADAVIDELPSIRSLNPDLDAMFVLPCRVTRTIHARTIVATLEGDHPEFVTSTRIRETIKLPEAAEARLPIMRHAPRSVGTVDYRAFARELLGPEPVRPAGTTDREPWWRQALSRAGVAR